MGDALRFTIRYSDDGDGWIMAQVEEVPGAISQGRTREQARENVTDATEPRFSNATKRREICATYR